MYRFDKRYLKHAWPTSTKIPQLRKGSTQRFYAKKDNSERGGSLADIYNPSSVVLRMLRRSKCAEDLTLCGPAKERNIASENPSSERIQECAYLCKFCTGGGEVGATLEKWVRRKISMRGDAYSRRSEIIMDSLPKSPKGTVNSHCILRMF